MRWRYTLMTMGLAALVLSAHSLAAPRTRAPKSLVEFAPHTASALGSLDVEVVAAAGKSTPTRLAVSDAALFVTKAGGDAPSALAAANGVTPPGNAPNFTVRLFIVAGGRLYAGGRGQCGAWQNDLARCSVACDGGSFALRRNGGAILELLIGAIPGGAAGSGGGVSLSGCDTDEGSEVKLVAKAGRGLAVAGFGAGKVDGVGRD